MPDLSAGADALRRIARPASVVVVGASADPTKLAGRTLPNLRRYGYSGPACAVNPGRDEVAGFPCFPTVSALPEAPESALVVTPAAAVVGVLRELDARGVGLATVVASGFGDDPSHEGQARAAELAEFMATSSMRILGPNSIGTIDTASNAVLRATTNLPDTLIPGTVSIATQSGAISLILLHQLHVSGLGVRQVIPLGNEADLGLPEAIMAAALDEQTSCLITFLESIRGPEALAEAMRVAQGRGLRVVAIVAGVSSTGSAIASGHTGALASDSRLTMALLRDVGIAVARGPREALEFADLASALSGRRVRKDGLALVCLSGGEAALLADRADDLGIDLPQPDGDVLIELSTLFRFAEPRNPLDVTADALTHPELFEKAHAVLSSDEHVDHLTFVLPPLANLDRERIYATLDKLPAGGVATSVVGWPVAGVHARVGEFSDSSAFLTAWAMAADADAFGRAVELCGERPVGTVAAPKWLSDDEVRKRIGAAGLDSVREVFVPHGQPVPTLDPTVTQWALKGSVAGVVHKTDWGGLVLGLRDQVEIAYAVETVRSRAEQRWPGQFRGVWLQEYVTGIEVYVGGVRHQQLGPFLAIGRGGTDVETQSGIAFIALPVEQQSLVSALIQLDIPEQVLCKRGQKPVDLAVLIEVCAAVARILDSDDVVSIDVNPVFLKPGAATAVDVRIAVTGASDG